MIEIDDSKYTRMVAKDAANLVSGLITKPPKAGRTDMQTAALAHAFAAMRRRGHSTGVTEKHLAIISYLTRNPTAHIFQDETITDALLKAEACLKADAAAERVTISEFARRY